MKILIIGSFDLFLHPYVEKYISIFKEKNIDYKFIYWNRKNICNNELNFIPFNFKLEYNSNKIKKIIGYIKFYRYTKKIIKKYKFDKIIVLASQTMFLFFNILRKKYKEKYIFDYRDETYEKYKFYNKIIRESIKNSGLTVVSSLGYVEDLFNGYQNKIVLCHNIKNNYYPCINPLTSKEIRVNFWGLIREVDYYFRVFDLFGNDFRFVVNLYGDGNLQPILKYIQKKQYKNIFVHGRFEQKDIPIFASTTDFLLNCYSNKGIQKNSLTIKMYEGIYYGVNLVIQKGSYMEKYLIANNVQFLAIDFDNFNVNNKENIKRNFIQFTGNDKIKVRDVLFDKFRNENQMFINRVINYIERGDKNE